MSGTGLRGRGSILPVLALALAAGCTGGAAPTYQPGGSGPVAPVGSADGPGDAATPGPIHEPQALEVAWADIQAQPEDTLVAISGRVKAGLMVSCFNDVCGLLLKDPSDDESSLIADVPAVAGAGCPTRWRSSPTPTPRPTWS